MFTYVPCSCILSSGSWATGGASNVRIRYHVIEIEIAIKVTGAKNVNDKSIIGQI